MSNAPCSRPCTQDENFMKSLFLALAIFFVVWIVPAQSDAGMLKRIYDTALEKDESFEKHIAAIESDRGGFVFPGVLP